MTVREKMKKIGRKAKEVFYFLVFSGSIVASMEYSDNYRNTKSFDPFEQSRILEQKRQKIRQLEKLADRDGIPGLSIVEIADIEYRSGNTNQSKNYHPFPLPSLEQLNKAIQSYELEGRKTK
jgi:hypothetical protein